MMKLMRRSINLQKSLGRLLVVVALLAQFAPAIHVLTPHPHDSSSCTHSAPRIHLEASTYDGKDAPCFVCAHLIHRQAPAITPGIVCETADTVAPKQPSLVVCTDKQALYHPDSRGPPHSL
jgi:hypothetical protein